MSAPLTVLKFGSSVLRDEADLPRVAAEIERHATDGRAVIAVVSAIGDATDSLLGKAEGLGATSWRESLVLSPRSATTTEEAALAALLATGESTAAALVGLSLSARGVPHAILDVGRVGPFTRGPLLDAEPCALDTITIQRTIEARGVAVLPGFVGHDEAGDVSLLGRGGSDLTALFVAHNLQAKRCLLVKDVGGVFEFDPRATHQRPRRFASLNWRDALDLVDEVMQRKAIQYAYRHRVTFEVGYSGGAATTVVGAKSTVLAARGRRLVPVRGANRAPSLAHSRDTERRVAACR